METVNDHPFYALEVSNQPLDVLGWRTGIIGGEPEQLSPEPCEHHRGDLERLLLGRLKQHCSANVGQW